MKIRLVSMLNRSALRFWVQGSKFTTGAKSLTILIEIRKTQHTRLGETSLNDETIYVLNTNFFKPIIPRFHCSNCERSAPVFAPGSSPRMKPFMQIFEMLACDMGIYLSRCNIDVPEHYLNSP